MKRQARTVPGSNTGISTAPTTYEEFMAQAEQADPERFAEVTERHPVLTQRQMRTRTEREIPVSQMSKGARILLDDLFYAGGEDTDSGDVD